jgi:hypothetical protein
MAANACPGRNLIDVPAGRYKLTLGSDLEITEEVTIIGAGRDTTAVEDVSGWGAFAVQHGGGIDRLSVIRQMTVEDSKYVPCVVVGREVFGTPPAETVLLLTDARLQNCRSRGRGGGMRIFRGGYAWLIDVDVSGNYALLGGGIANTDGKLEVWKSRFSNNAGAQGGAIYSQGPYSPPLPETSDDRVIIRDSNFSNNNAVEGAGYMAQGGALHVEWHAVRVTRSRFELNAAEAWGGAISLMGVGPATLENVEMWKNRARLGGGGMLGDMDIKASKLVAVGNQVLGGDGGGLYLGKDFEVSDALIKENVAQGRQIPASGVWVGGRGGGVAVIHGGGAMRNATITANRAREGGGHYNYGFSALVNVTVSMNGASQSGGGARNYAGEMWIKNGTFFRNDAPEASALSSFSSYPLSVGPDFPLTYINHTILVAGTTGQVACRDDHFILTNGNDRGIISKGYNLPGDSSCGTIHNTDLSPTNPQLGPLADNGGFAPTHRPAPGSAALNRGANISEPYYNQDGCAPQDARGVTRPQASVSGGQVRCDIGALELTPLD